MSYSFGHALRVTIFGQSHGEAIGTTIDGLPAGFTLDYDDILAFMARRAPGKNKFSTPRKEKDQPQILSGTVDNVTCGAPLTAIIQNTNTKSGDYANLHDVPRPMHADYPAFIKYNGCNDIRGGGQFSGRLTAPLCFAGAVAKQYLAVRNIFVGAHISSIGNVADARFDSIAVTKKDFDTINQKDFPVISQEKGELMQEVITAAKEDGDSVGGTIECAIIGVPAGIGEPLYDGIENRLAANAFGIPAVKAIEFGCGFEATTLRGSEHNDSFTFQDGKVITETNRHGGILGGISTGMPITFKVAVKPTPSIAKEQKSVSLSKQCDTPLAINGRHDPCIVPRAVPCVEAVAAITILDLILEAEGHNTWQKI